MTNAELVKKCESLEKQLSEMQDAFRTNSQKFRNVDSLLREFRQELDGIKLDIARLKQKDQGGPANQNYDMSVQRHL